MKRNEFRAAPTGTELVLVSDYKQGAPDGGSVAALVAPCL